MHKDFPFNLLLDIQMLARFGVITRYICNGTNLIATEIWIRTKGYTFNYMQNNRATTMLYNHFIRNENR